MCDEIFMIETDLLTHVSSKHQCTFHRKMCAEKITFNEHIEKHVITLHNNCQEMSCQTDQYNCDHCDKIESNKEL